MANIFEVDRFGKSEEKITVNEVFSGEVKGIAIPISFAIKNKKKKRQEIRCYFSASKQNNDFSEEISKQLKELYKYGKYAPHTHLIPMNIQKRTRIEDPVFMGVDFSQLKYAITDDALPATATLGETMEFFPCYDDVLEMMLCQLEYPSFYITLLPDAAILQIKYGKSRYRCIPMQHVHGACSEGIGHSCIHIMDEFPKWVRRFEQIDWVNIAFENEIDMNMSIDFY